ncbi:MAG: DegT/DnrJ/EryC1/StrS family aminotransferase [Geminicoccaceae bacterium]
MTSRGFVVPHADPGAEYRAMKGSIDGAVHRVLASGQYVLGGECAGFEDEFAGWLGVARAVSCASGTDALILAMKALGIGPGCSIVTVSHTAVAVVAAIELVGATPILIDVDPDHYTMDPMELAAVLDHRPLGWPPVRGVIPVHLYGQSADMDAILQICARREVPVIEDCSQAHGATWHGRMVGTFGSMAAFSLYPTKNLGALGDAGVLVTSDETLADRAGSIRQYGWGERFHSEQVGMNSRLDELQAGILRAKLPYLDAMNRRRRVIASAYDAVLADSCIAPPVTRPGAEHAFNQYVVRAPDRDALRSRLLEEGIGTGVHYPVPIHRQSAYAGRLPLGPSGCRRTEAVATEIMGLPIFPELTDAQVDHVCSALHRLGRQ